MNTAPVAGLVDIPASAVYGRFYILTHDKIRPAIEARMRDILEDRLPTDVSRPLSQGARKWPTAT